MASGGLLPWDNRPALEIHWRLGPELGVAIQCGSHAFCNPSKFLVQFTREMVFEDDNVHSATTG